MTAHLPAARATFDAYTRACAEIAALDALPYREGFMRARNAQRRDCERLRDSARRRMVRMVTAMWRDVWPTLDAKGRREVKMEVKGLKAVA